MPPEKTHKQPEARSAPPTLPRETAAHLAFKRQELVDKMERISALDSHRDHDHDAALKRCRDGIAEIDRALKGAG